MSPSPSYWQYLVNTGISPKQHPRTQLRYRVFNRSMFYICIIFALLAINAGTAGREMSVVIQIFRIIGAIGSVLIIKHYGLSPAVISVLIWNTMATIALLYFLPVSTFNLPSIFLEYLLVFYFFPRQHLLRNILAGFILVTGIIIVYIESKKEQPAFELMLAVVLLASIAYFIFLQLFLKSDQKYKEELQGLNAELEQSQRHTQELLMQEKRRRKEIEHLHQELKEAQQNLLIATQKQTLQGSAASIMHGINNPLNYIVSGAEVVRGITSELVEHIEEARKAYANEEDLAPHFQNLKLLIEEEQLMVDLEDVTEAVITGSKRISDVLNVFRTLSEVGNSHTREDDIRITVESAFKKACQLKNTPSAVLDMDVAQNLCYLDHDLIDEALFHLFKNSIEAQEAPQYIKVEAQAEKDCYCIRVIDKGKGVADEAKEQLFEPFFSTKAQMGLGLTLVKSLVEAMSGTLSLIPDEEQTIFEIWLALQSQ